MKQITQHFDKMHSRGTGLLVLRVVTGLIFISHGYMKLSDMTSTIGFFASLGLGAFFAYLVALVELVGGISLIVGYFARYSAFALSIVMIFAIILVKSKFGIKTAELELMLLASSFLILFSGCGKYSLCAMMHHKSCASCKDNGSCSCQHGK